MLMMCLSLPLMGDEADKKKFEEAKVKAEKGDADAQYQVGVMYRDGKTVNADLKQAFRHFKKSADQGHVMAQYELGVLHLHGKGVKRDAIAAFTWLNIIGKTPRINKTKEAEAFITLSQEGEGSAFTASVRTEGNI